jgi:hypothetical protein
MALPIFHVLSPRSGAALVAGARVPPTFLSSRGTPRWTPRPHPLFRRHDYKGSWSPLCPPSFHHFPCALLTMKNPNALPFASCPSTVPGGPPPHRILAEAPPSRPSVSTTTSSSLINFAMSHSSAQPLRALGPFHLCLQPPRQLVIDESPPLDCEPPPHHRYTIWVSPRPAFLLGALPKN